MGICADDVLPISGLSFVAPQHHRVVWIPVFMRPLRPLSPHWGLWGLLGPIGALGPIRGLGALGVSYQGSKTLVQQPTFRLRVGFGPNTAKHDSFNPTAAMNTATITMQLPKLRPRLQNPLHAQTL